MSALGFSFLLKENPFISQDFSLCCLVDSFIDGTFPMFCFYDRVKLGNILVVGVRRVTHSIFHFSEVDLIKEMGGNHCFTVYCWHSVKSNTALYFGRNIQGHTQLIHLCPGTSSKQSCGPAQRHQLGNSCLETPIIIIWHSIQVQTHKHFH